MFRSTLKDEHNCVLIKVKNSCSGPNTNAPRESFEHTVDSLFIGMETAKDAIITTAKSSKFTGSTSRNIIYLAFSMDYGSRGKIMEFTRNIST